MRKTIQATTTLSLIVLAAGPSALCPQAGAADTVSPLPASDYAVRQVCAAPTAGHAGCLALQLVPKTATARAHTHPLGMTRSAPLAAPTPAEGAYGLRPQDLNSAYFPGEQPDAPASEPQTIALVDAYDDPNAQADLETYDKAFGLPPCTEANDCFKKVNQNGETGHPPTAKSSQEKEEALGWALETSTDIEVARGVCQNCHIVLVEATSTLLTNLETAEETAAKSTAAGGVGATEISDSWGSEEPASDSAAFNHPDTVITAAAGDGGYLNWTEAKEPKSGYFVGADYPAASPHVVAVGGTKLTLEGSAGKSETVWNEDPDPEGTDDGAGGSGCSQRFTAQEWQQSVADWSAVGCEGWRAVADVSADGDPYTGVAVYDSTAECEYEEGGVIRKLHWCTIGGTSVASPIIASVFALAGGAHGVAYPAKTLYSHLGSTSLYDVVNGGNGECDGNYSSGCSGSIAPLSPLDCGQGVWICNAAPGYDGPTGVGTPNGIAAFVPVVSEQQSKEEEHSQKSGSGQVSASASASGTSASPSGGGSSGPSVAASTSTDTATIQLSGLALTPNALVALNRTRPKVSLVAFAFTLNAPARVRVALAKQVRARGHTRWQTLPDSLTFAAARGRGSRHLSGHNALAPGRYRLTLTPLHGTARSLVFQLG
jgi:subtilase family serine protease